MASDLHTIEHFFSDPRKVRAPLASLWLELRFIDDSFLSKAIPSLYKAMQYPSALALTLYRLLSYLATARVDPAKAEAVAFFVDAQAFFITLRVLFEEVAFATQYFYPNLRSQIPCRSFNDQIQWFLANENVDVEYSSYLRDRLSWFPLLKDIRDKICHPHIKDDLSFDLGPDFLYELAIISPKTLKFEGLDFEQYLKSVVRRAFHFLYFYEDHFLKRIGKPPTAKEQEFRYAYLQWEHAAFSCLNNVLHLNAEE